MRIAITGTHGTGKTTLATELARKLGLPLITEQARRVAVNIGAAGETWPSTYPQKKGGLHNGLQAKV
ncbi:MAG TPA: AAA family ATPase [Desulfotomaculum sp.]|nr:AAA family ATPase [Desulfotomaculum sp.]